MVPAGKIIADVESRRLMETPSKEEPEGKPPEASETGDTAAAESSLEDINDALPKEVATGFGIIKYGEFKERFSEIYEQVRDKDHLINGRIVYAGTIAGIPVKMHNLRAGERRALLPIMPNPQMEDLVQYNLDDLTYRLHVLAVALDGVADISFTHVSAVKGVPIDEWTETSSVVQAIDALEGLDEYFLTMLYQLFIDINNAKQYALIENLKNQ
jgi:hypothetical protein